MSEKKTEKTDTWSFEIPEELGFYAVAACEITGERPDAALASALEAWVSEHTSKKFLEDRKRAYMKLSAERDKRRGLKPGRVERPTRGGEKTEEPRKKKKS